MDSPKTSDASREDYKAGLLSTSFDMPENTRPRSTSASSARSTITFLDEHSKVPKLDRRAIQRRRTQVAEVKISWWQCLKGVLLGPRVTERAATATIVIPPMEENDDMFAEDECPWILIVFAVSSAKVGTEVHQKARCTFDTGNLQGNIISKEFALKLGYTESDFEPLRPKERNGGTSATGHMHMPEGALHITWYHNSSPRLYDGMRFLVSSETQCELIVGARSILRHRLLSPPNLSLEDDRRGITNFKPGSDKALDKLRSKQAKLAEDLKTLKHKLKAANKEEKEDDAKQLQAEIKKGEKKLAISKLEVELYSAEKDLKSDPQSQTRQAVVDLVKSELKAAKGEESTAGAESANTPHVNISEPNGTTRSATGFSLNPVRSWGRSRAR